MARKAADLNTLLRLRSWTVDECRRELGILVAREEELILFGEELDRQLIREQVVAAADPLNAGMMYSVFAQYHRLRREELMRKLALLREEIAEAREKLNDAYREQKVMEEVQKHRQRNEDQEEARREQAVFDEIGQTQFRQRLQP
ncbi:MAG TPA: flagellar FliJ family protein [Rhodospirillaceae bacterium]|nr:flagellar FliJ family protein [Rhodospirillaceae bacterium]